jgi:PEP-CTERM motif
VKKNLVLLIMSAVLSMSSVGAVHAAFTVYNDTGTWYGATTTAYPAFYFNQIDFTTPVTHTGTLIPVTSINQQVNVAVNSNQTSPTYGVTQPLVNRWYDQFGLNNSTTFTFKSTTNTGRSTTSAFMTNFDFGQDPVDPSASGIIVSVLRGTTTLQTYTIPQSFGSGYWGILGATSSDYFDSIMITGGIGGVPQTLQMTDTLYSSVPEPSTFMLIGSGLCGLVYWRRRKA